MSRTVWIMLGLVGALTAGVAALSFSGVWAKFGSSDDPPPLPERTAVNALGRLEPSEGVIDLAVPVGDRIGTVNVKAGDEVSAGQELARMQSYDDRLAEKNLAAAQLAEAETRLKAITVSGKAQLAEADLRIAQIKNLGPLDIQPLKTKVTLLQDQLAQALKNQQRTVSLKPGTTSAQELEQQNLLVKQAKAELLGARNLLEKAEKGNELNLESAEAQRRTLESTLKRGQQEVPLTSAQKSLEAAEQRLKNAILRAPTAGTILKVFGRPGESGNQLPFLRMADLRQMVVVAEVYETDVRYLRPGMRATVTSAALDHELSGAVTSIGRSVARNSVFELNPAANADHRVVEVRIRLDPDPAAARYINLQVNVAIPLDEAARR